MSRLPVAVCSVQLAPSTSQDGKRITGPAAQYQDVQAETLAETREADEAHQQPEVEDAFSFFAPGLGFDDDED